MKKEKKLEKKPVKVLHLLSYSMPICLLAHQIVYGFPVRRIVHFFISLLLNLFIVSWYTSFGSLCWATVSAQCSTSSPSFSSRRCRYIIRILTSMPSKFNGCSSSTTRIGWCLVEYLVWWTPWTLGTFSFSRLSTWITVSKQNQNLQFFRNILFSYSIPHGICSCLTLARTVAIQAKHLFDNDVKQLASLLPFITTTTDAQFSTDPREQAIKVAEAIDQLISDLGLTSTLREYNVPESDFEGIIERALPDGKADLRYPSFIKLLQAIY